MYTKILVLFFGLLLNEPALVQVSPVTVLSDTTIILEDFKNETIGDLPSNWYNRDGNRNPIHYEGTIRDEYQYRVLEENGKRFLRYEGSHAKHILLPLGNNDEIDVRKTPLLRWEWRVHELPANANEDDDKLNDVAASIYVVWGFNMLRVPKVVRYTWSSTLEKGFIGSKNMNLQHIVVMESGTDNIGSWLTFERNIVDDYKRFFRGNVPKRPVAILILSDADNTQSFAKADYAMIVLQTEK